MNNCTFIGRLVRDPELRQTNSNKAVVSFTIASDYGVTREGEKKTAFIDCVAWEKKAEFINKYFVKGDPICVTGPMTTRNWEKDGQKHKATELEVREANFVPAPRKKDGDPTEAQPGDDFNDIDDGELPF